MKCVVAEWQDVAKTMQFSALLPLPRLPVAHLLHSCCHLHSNTHTAEPIFKQQAPESLTSILDPAYRRALIASLNNSQASAALPPYRQCS